MPVLLSFPIYDLIGISNENLRRGSVVKGATKKILWGHPLFNGILHPLQSLELEGEHVSQSTLSGIGS